MKLFSMVLAVAGFALASLAAVPAQIVEARTQYESALDAAAKPVKERYVRELEQIKSRAMALKNLELAKEADDQIKNPEDAPKGLPNDVATARERYDDGLAQARRPITDRYVTELQQLKSRAMTEKNLELAKASDNEIERVKAGGAAATPMIGKWVLNHPAVGARGLRIEIKPDNTCSGSNGDIGKWVVEDGSLVMSWGNGWKNRVPAFAGGNIVKGDSQSPGGKKWVNGLTLTKAK